ncbi:hypothetical protein UPF0324 [Gottschalkia acidurici 9a]|uniref:Sulfate exporter family transporter n=1 Tax=Gottschalkia acidurici (strain ATCC 7906 / DSM 604 / BCRC 14475 / CIP 104303 / KCTC 5404 / NCIMB 10678 / 9a) TaxID=1128398 RepID=K0B0U7_GOTA9|nr:putative sulfate exporter family transporter [Gottschalkia acidurici]AFS79144.1 hypothetical protein UPF0324 [Gottschalkia acidurici 9a]
MKYIKILPGLIVCILIAYLGQFLGSYIPSIGGASIAIFLGILLKNTLLNNKLFEKGSTFAESNLLSYSIVLLGGTLSAKTIMQIGNTGVTFIVIQMTITILGAIFIGKKLGFSKKFRFLMASGNAVCGSSAIGATAPAIGASDEDKSISITIVNVTGTVLMLLLPLIAKFTFSYDTVKTSALIGGVLQSVGQVVASGSMVSLDVKDLSTIFKIVRIIFLVFVVLSFSMLNNDGLDKKNIKNKSKLSNIKVPWYVVGFFIMCFLFTVGIIPSEISRAFKSISNSFEIIALAGIGMRVNLKSLIKQGFKISVYAILIALVQVVSALSLITLLIS